MPNQQTTSQNIRPFARVVLVALVLIIAAEGLDLPARPVLDLLTAVVQHTLVFLPSLALTAWQGLHPVAFEHPRISICALDLLVFWPLLSSASSVG